MDLFIAWTTIWDDEAPKLAVLADDTEALRRKSQAMEAGRRIIESWLLRAGGQTIDFNGANGHCQVPAEELSDLERIRSQYAQTLGDVRVAVGVGVKLSEADQALKSAVRQGGDKIVLYTPADAKEPDDQALNKAAPPAMNQGPGGGFAGATRPALPSVAAPHGEASEHSQAEAEASLLENAPPVAELTHSAADAEEAFTQHADRADEDEKSQGEASGKAAADQDLKQEVLKVLQGLKAQSRVLGQVAVTEPKLFAVIQESIKAMLMLAKRLCGTTAPGAADPVTKSEPERDDSEDPILKSDAYFRSPAFLGKNGQIIATPGFHDIDLLPKDFIIDREGYVGGDGTFYDRETAEEMVKPAKPLVKMAIKDLPPGPRLPPDPTLEDEDQQTLFDYSHLLPRAARGQYKLTVEEHGDEYSPKQSAVLQLRNDTDSTWIGDLKAGTHWDHKTDKPYLSVQNVQVHEHHRKQGLGQAMYEATYAHAFHVKGIREVRGGLHSTAASKQHEALAMKHGLGYKAIPNPFDASWGRQLAPQATGTDYDQNKGPYEYSLNEKKKPKKAAKLGKEELDQVEDPFEGPLSSGPELAKTEYRSGRTKEDMVAVPGKDNPGRRAYDRSIVEMVYRKIAHPSQWDLKPKLVNVADLAWNSSGNGIKNPSRYNMYRRMLANNDRLPAIVIRRNGLKYDIIDGSHRVAATLGHNGTRVAEPKKVQQLMALEMVPKKPLAKANPPHEVNQVLADALMEHGFQPTPPQPKLDSSQPTPKNKAVLPLRNSTHSFVEGAVTPEIGQRSDHVSNQYDNYRRPPSETASNMANYREAAKLGFSQNQSDMLGDNGAYFQQKPFFLGRVPSNSVDQDDENWGGPNDGQGQLYPGDLDEEKRFWTDILHSLPPESITKKLPLPENAPKNTHHVFPIGAVKDHSPQGTRDVGKVKVAHSDGKAGWVEVRAGQVLSSDGHPISSRNPGGK